MSANPIDRDLLRLARIGQGCKPSRCSLNPARRKHVAMRRTERLARLGQ